MPQDFVALELSKTRSNNPPVDNLPSRQDYVNHLRALIEYMVIHAVEADVPSRSDFQQEVKAIGESIQGESSRDDLEAAINKVLRAVERYNSSVSNAFEVQSAELRGLLKSLTETVVFLTGGTETSVKQLDLIGSKLAHAVSLKDAVQMRTMIQESLSLVLVETQRVQNETRSKAEELKSEVGRLSELLKSAKLTALDDPITGLPGRAAAEQAIEAGISTGKQFAISLFIIDRLVSINGRFGRLVGDQVLVNAALTLAQRLHGATLYRWSGPAFLAIFDPSVNVTAAESQARRAASFRVEKDIEIGERSALVVITCSLHFRSITPKSSTPAAIVGDFDACLVSQEGVAK